MRAQTTISSGTSARFSAKRFAASAARCAESYSPSEPVLAVPADAAS
jgi:hypothetical protein